MGRQRIFSAIKVATGNLADCADSVYGSNIATSNFTTSNIVTAPAEIEVR